MLLITKQMVTRLGRHAKNGVKTMKVFCKVKGLYYKKKVIVKRNARGLGKEVVGFEFQSPTIAPTTS